MVHSRLIPPTSFSRLQGKATRSSVCFLFLIIRMESLGLTPSLKHYLQAPRDEFSLARSMPTLILEKSGNRSRRAITSLKIGAKYLQLAAQSFQLLGRAFALRISQHS